MLAGNMGAGAFNVLQNQGIKVFRGCSGEVSAVVRQYLQGNLQDSEIEC